jgi:hypothetical protein
VQVTAIFLQYPLTIHLDKRKQLRAGIVDCSTRWRSRSGMSPAHQLPWGNKPLHRLKIHSGTSTREGLACWRTECIEHQHENQRIKKTNPVSIDGIRSHVARSVSRKRNKIVCIPPSSPALCKHTRGGSRGRWVCRTRHAIPKKALKPSNRHTSIHFTARGTWVMLCR